MAALTLQSGALVAKSFTEFFDTPGASRPAVPTIATLLGAGPSGRTGDSSRPTPPPPPSLVRHLTPVYVHVETLTNNRRGPSLQYQSLKGYLRQTSVTRIEYAIGDGPLVTLGKGTAPLTNDEKSKAINDLQIIAGQGALLVTHHAAFQARALVVTLGLSYPVHIWCTQEIAMATWPDLPGGFALEELFAELSGPTRRGPTPDRLTMLRYVFQRESRRLPYQEQAIALMTHRTRRLALRVDAARYQALAKELRAPLEQALGDARTTLGSDGNPLLSEADAKLIFGTTNGSVAYGRLQTALSGAAGEKLVTTSFKHLPADFQERHPEITEMIKHIGFAAKSIEQIRKAKRLRNVSEVFVELAFYGAVTGRFSSPSLGAGVNLHGIPKHYTPIARPVRQCFRAPEGFCLVRGDLANVEFRVTGLVTGCRAIHAALNEAAGGDRMQDPYVNAWKAMVGQVISKKDPVRQVAKTAVLGLTFLQSAGGYAAGLSRALADSTSGITKEVLASVVSSERQDSYLVRKIIGEKGCSELVASAAIKIHAAFHAAHPEIKQLAEWLFAAVEGVARPAPPCGASVQQALERGNELDLPLLGVEVIIPLVRAGGE